MVLSLRIGFVHQQIYNELHLVLPVIANSDVNSRCRVNERELGRGDFRGRPQLPIVLILGIGIASVCEVN